VRAVTIPPPLTVTRLLTEARPDVAWLVISVALAGLYVLGVRRLAVRGRPWSPARTTSFLVGVGVLGFATSSGLAAYDRVLFSAHVAQHLLLGMVAPMLLALGAPITLALQASSRATQVGLLGMLGSKVGKVLAHPAVAWLVFGGSMVVLYTTPLYELSLRNGSVHGGVHVHMFLAGCLFFWAVVGIDRAPVQLSHPARLGLVLLAVPFHAFLGIVLLSTDQVIAADWYAELGRTWGASALSDQKTGAGLMWGVGDLLGLVAGGVVLVQWMAHDEREARRLDRRLDEERAAAAAARERILADEHAAQG
jgi:putative copper resistance protein D